MSVPDTLVNRTRHTILFERPKFALTAWQQMKGFMFRRPKDECIIFLFLPARKVHFHMLFVFGPIDIIALDGKGMVLAMRENFRPWTLWNPGVSASAVIELPAGTISRTKTQLGDTILLPAQKRSGAVFALLLAE